MQGGRCTKLKSPRLACYPEGVEEVYVLVVHTLHLVLTRSCVPAWQIFIPAAPPSSNLACRCFSIFFFFTFDRPFPLEPADIMK